MKVKFTVKGFLISTLIEGVISLIILFIIPGDPKNTWVLGLSKSRFVMVIINLLAITLISIFTRKISKDQSRYARVSTRVENLLKWDGHLTTGLVFSLAGLVGGGISWSKHLQRRINSYWVIMSGYSPGCSGSRQSAEACSYF